MATMTETMTDTELQRMVYEELQWEPRIDPARIGVSVEDGVVTLSAHLTTYAQKHAAEKAAKRVDGVKAVANEIEVRLLEGAGRSEEELARAALEALEAHLFVPADDIRVAVSDGWITLEGAVRWQFQRKAAEKAVRYLPGVTRRPLAGRRVAGIGYNVRLFDELVQALVPMVGGRRSA